MSATAVWGQLRDWTRFLSLDPLHVEIAPTGSDARGIHLIIRHRLLGVGVDRVGRVLAWREGQGYAISDLSARGVRVGFPHICTCRVHPISPNATRVTLGARGRWTASWIPRWAVRLWIAWVLHATAARTRSDLVRHARWLSTARGG